MKHLVSFPLRSVYGAFISSQQAPLLCVMYVFILLSKDSNFVI